jgi:hypothetical protein
MRPDSPDCPDQPSPTFEPGNEEPLAASTEAGPEDDAACQYFENDAHQRLWLRTIIPLLQLRSGEVDPSCRVQFAIDRMYISACERITRILRGDLHDEPA